MAQTGFLLDTATLVRVAGESELATFEIQDPNSRQAA
jgi:hypothetical protein